jgi:hypothetical protein
MVLFQFALEARTRREAADSATARQGEATQLSFSMRIGITLNGTAVDGADTYTMSLSITPATDETFEGVVRKKSLEVLTLKKNGAVLNATNIDGYYSTAPFVQWGARYPDGTYAVQTSSTNVFPATAKVGESGAAGTLTLYTSSNKAAVQSTTQSTWTLEADTATTAWSCVNVIVKNAAGLQTSTSAGCTKFDTSGNSLGMRYTLSVAGKTLVFK